ncbi:MAG: hypothetical protein U1A77_24020 [Pirellulales bacterium]
MAAQMCANPPADLLAQFPDLKDRVGPRACILNDLSPAACHIAYNYNTPVDTDALRREFERIKAAVKDEFDWLYGTEHYEPAVGLYSPKKPELLARLKNPPAGAATARLLNDSVDRTWELLTRAEVESRLGYPVNDLPSDSAWGELNVAEVDQWICIPATIQYTIWSDVYRCEGFVTVEEPTGKISTRGKNAGKPIMRKKRVARGCANDIILWNTAVDQETGKVSEQFRCPQCAIEWKKTQLKRVANIPVATSYQYLGVASKSAGPQSRSASAKLRSERRVTHWESARFREIEAKALTRWIPQQPLDTKGPQYSRNALAARNVRVQADFYTSRNFRALAIFWDEFQKVTSDRLSAALQFLWSSIYHRCSRRTKWHRSRLGQAALSGQLYIPSLQVENNIELLLSTKLAQVVRGLHALAATPGQVAIMCGPAGQLPCIPDGSIDYVFCDPPFGSNIYYSELNLLWEAWFGRVTDRDQEAVVHRKNDRGRKTIDDYSRLMSESLRETYRVLKPGRCAMIEFNNNDGRVFEAIKAQFAKSALKS